MLYLGKDSEDCYTLVPSHLNNSATNHRHNTKYFIKHESMADFVHISKFPCLIHDCTWRNKLENYAKCSFPAHESNYNKNTIVNLSMNHWNKTCTWASINLFASINPLASYISISEYENHNEIHLKYVDYASNHIII